MKKNLQTTFFSFQTKCLILYIIFGFPPSNAATGPTFEWPSGNTGQISKIINAYDSSDPMKPPISLDNLIIKNNSGRDFADMTITTGRDYLNFNFFDGKNTTEKTIGAGLPAGSQSIDLQFAKPIKSGSTVDLIVDKYQFSSPSLDPAKSYSLKNFFNTVTSNILLYLTPSLKEEQTRACAPAELLQTLIASGGCSSRDKNYAFNASILGVDPSTTYINFSYDILSNSNTVSISLLPGTPPTSGSFSYTVAVNDSSSDYLFGLTADLDFTNTMNSEWNTVATNSFGSCSSFSCNPGLSYQLYEVNSLITNSWSSTPSTISNTISQAPGPLPLAGAFISFGFSRKLRSRVKSCS